MHRVHSRWHKPKSRLTPKQKAQRQAATAASLASESQENVPSSSTANKLRRFEGEGVPESNREEDFFIMHSDVFSEIFKEVACNACGEKKLAVSPEKIQGFARCLRLKCEACGLLYCEVNSSPFLDQPRHPAFLINRRMVEAHMFMGVGYASMLSLGREVGISVMSKTAFFKQLKQIEKENVTLKQLMLEKTHKAIRESLGVGQEEIIDMAISFDGTWQKRGHTSLNGAAFVIDIESGLVLDFIVLSKHCQYCATKSSSCDEESEYKEWLQKHIESGECQKNYDGTSGAMEKTAAEHLWLRSEHQWNMRYTHVLSDGDSSTYDHLCNLDPYKGVQVVKEECINHMSKRLGTSLRELVKTEKARGVTLGGKGDGTLKETTITKLTSYYRNAVVRNIPNVKEMQKSIFATLDHCVSTDAKPNHKNCPPGKDSWCFYQSAKASGKTPKKHTEMSLKLSEEVVKKIRPIYIRLSSETLLERCSRGGTQNSNESLHSLLWRKCAKEVFASRARIEVAAVQAASEFNMGYTAALQMRRGAEGISSTSLATAQKQDARRKDQSAKQKAITKKRALKKQKRAAESKKTKQSNDYKGGGH